MKGGRIKQALFGRWYIFHPTDDLLGWSGSQWVACTKRGIPTAMIQLCNFASEREATEYAARMPEAA